MNQERRDPFVNKEDSISLLEDVDAMATTNWNIDVVELPLMKVQAVKITSEEKDHEEEDDNNNDDHDETYEGDHNHSVTNDYAFFAGVGFDALMLQDYKDIHEWATDTTAAATAAANHDSPQRNNKQDSVSQPHQDNSDNHKSSNNRNKSGIFHRFLKDTLLGGVSGYTAALFTKTLPKCIQRQAHLMQVRITTTQPKDAYWIDHRLGQISIDR